MKANWSDSNHRTDVRDGYCETYIPTRHQCLPKTDWLFAAVEGKDKIRFVADTESLGGKTNDLQDFKKGPRYLDTRFL